MSEVFKEPKIQTSEDLQEFVCAITSDVRKAKTSYVGEPKASKVFMMASERNFEEEIVESSTSHRKEKFWIVWSRQ